MGYDTLHVPETLQDSLTVAMLALEHTSTLRVRTSVTLAFPRSPMLVAYSAWSVQEMGAGRFELGLGPQIKQNIVERYSVPWTDPVERIREYVESLRAIWHSFQTGGPLRYEGDHYRFTRLQPFFNPGPHGHQAPALWLGGVGDRMCRLGGSQADGFVTHPTNSNPRYLRELCLPALAAGAEGRSRPPVRLITGTNFITGPDAAAVDASRETNRVLIGFLLSTPAYRRTLTLYGWAELGERLQQMTRAGGWDQMRELVTDEVLDTLVPQGTWEELPAVIETWFGGLVDGVILPVPLDPADDDRFTATINAVRSVASAH
jgi:probable F420-dependent oxidoreductase